MKACQILASAWILTSGLLGATSGHADSPYQVTVIADSRQPVLGFSYTKAEASMNNAGQVLFIASGPQGSALFLSDGTSPTLIAQAQSPGIGQGSNILYGAINNHGRVLYDTGNGISTDNKTWLWENGQVSLYADYPANPPPGRMVFAGALASFGFSDNDRVAFPASRSGRRLVIANSMGVQAISGAGMGGGASVSLSDNGKFAAATGSASNPARYGVIALGGPRDQYFLGLAADSEAPQPRAVAINNHGLLAFTSARPGISGGDFLGLIDVRSGAMEYRQLLGEEQGFEQFGAMADGLAISNLNEIAFAALPAGDNGGLGNSTIFVSNTAGSTPFVVLRRGDTVTADGATFKGVVNSSANTFQINDSGQISFEAHLLKDGVPFRALLRLDPREGLSPGNPIMPDEVPGLGEPWVVRIALDPALGNRPIFIDPEIAYGYRYAVADEAPAFGGVLIPAALAGGDEDFILRLDGQEFALKAGEHFDFTSITSGGIRSFSIVGIDANESLSPADPGAFVTGLSFTGLGAQSFDVSMLPLTTAVPEAPARLLLVAGLATLAWRRRR